MPDLSTDHSSATLEGAHSHGARRAYVSSRADRPTSFDPADIPVPGGREEEWRFTPMRRFRPLFDLDAVRAGTAAARVAVTVDAPEGAHSCTGSAETHDTTAAPLGLIHNPEPNAHKN